MEGTTNGSGFKLIVVIFFTALITSGITAFFFTQADKELAEEQIVEVSEELPLDEAGEAQAEPCLEEYWEALDGQSSLRFQYPCDWEAEAAQVGTTISGDGGEVFIVYPGIDMGIHGYEPIEPRSIFTNGENLTTSSYYNSQEEAYFEAIELNLENDPYNVGRIDIRYKTEKQKAQVDTLLESFRIEPIMDGPGGAEGIMEEIAFDACGNMGDYYNKDWFQDFLAQYESAQNPTTIGNGDYVNDRTELCLSLDGNTVIILSRVSQYMETDAQIFKYNVDSNTLSEAIYDADFNGETKFSEFKNRDGLYVVVVGREGDAGYGEEWTSHYYYNENRVELKKMCTLRNRDVNGEMVFGIDECTNY